MLRSLTHLLEDVFGEVNTLNKIFQKEKLDLSENGDAIEFCHMVFVKETLVDEDDKFGLDITFVAQFLNVF